MAAKLARRNVLVLLKMISNQECYASLNKSLVVAMPNFSTYKTLQLPVKHANWVQMTMCSEHLYAL